MNQHEIHTIEGEDKSFLTLTYNADEDLYELTVGDASNAPATTVFVTNCDLWTLYSVIGSELVNCRGSAHGVIHR